MKAPRMRLWDALAPPHFNHLGRCSGRSTIRDGACLSQHRRLTATPHQADRVHCDNAMDQLNGVYTYWHVTDMARYDIADLARHLHRSLRTRGSLCCNQI